MLKTLNVGLVAHVDAGKTTLTEQLLYTAGALRGLGRVDAQVACPDRAGDLPRDGRLARAGAAREHHQHGRGARGRS